MAKVEWHPGELYPGVGFIVTNLSRPATRVTKFYNGRGTAEQWIKEGKNAINWTRLSCHSFRNNAVRLQLHALAYNLGNFLCTLALPEAVEHWSLTTLREKLIKIGAKVVRHGRYATFQLAEVAIPRALFAEVLHLIDGLRPAPLPPRRISKQNHPNLPSGKLSLASVEVCSPSVRLRAHQPLNGQIGPTKPGDRRAMSQSKMASSPTTPCATIFGW